MKDTSFYCTTANEHIYDPDSHCGERQIGQKALGQAVRQPKRPGRLDITRDERRDER